jgi:hypothetical protein
MAQPMLTTNEAPAESLPLEQQNDRLMALVGELLAANQQLRFKVAELEQQSKRTASALADASAVYALLLP